MTAFTRYMKYQFPLIKGQDVHQVQARLLSLGYRQTGEADGKYGVLTDKAVRAFQVDRGLLVDGIVGPDTWKALFGQEAEGPAPPEDDRIGSVLPRLRVDHRYLDSIAWRLEPGGIYTEDGGIERTPGQPQTVARVWERFGFSIDRWSVKFGVPAELIVAVICTESGGDPGTVREEPGYESDVKTPHRVSPGLMQTLISTARETLQDQSIDREWLLEPGNSIQAGTAYIARQWKATTFDPPKVACAYNAGGVYPNHGPQNRWKMRQYPIGTSAHADRYVKWYNDFYALMASREDIRPQLSFFPRLHHG